jgi:hypothetical protein
VFQLPSGNIYMLVSNRSVIIKPDVSPGLSKAENLMFTVPEMPTNIDHAPWIYP